MIRGLFTEKDGEILYALDLNTYLQAKETKANAIMSKKFAKALDGAKKSILLEQYKNYIDVFSKEGFDLLLEKCPWDHAIQLKDSFQLVDCKVYPLNRAEQKQLADFIDKNLESKRIQPSLSPMASPVFFIKKKDGSLQLVQDYRKLNEWMVKDRYPLLLIQELLDKLKGAGYFIKFNIHWGYNNVRIREGDEWKAAFRTNLGLYKPTVMFFRLTNSPAMFQRMMNTILHDLIQGGKVIVYLNNILIFTRDLNEH